MAKKHAAKRHHVHHRPTHHRASAPSENYLVLVRGWMLVVAFALMLGMGALVGSFINAQLNAATPTVAGVTTSR